MNRIIEVLRKFVGARSKWEVYESGQHRRLLWGIVSSPEDIAKNPQLVARHWLTNVDHPELGEALSYPGTPYRLSESPWVISRRPPLVGEHNKEILGGELGVSEEELKKLQASGAV